MPKPRKSCSWSACFCTRIKRSTNSAMVCWAFARFFQVWKAMAKPSWDAKAQRQHGMFGWATRIYAQHNPWFCFPVREFQTHSRKTHVSARTLALVLHYITRLARDILLHNTSCACTRKSYSTMPCCESFWNSSMFPKSFDSCLMRF